jgi:hypothetical protein
MRRMILSLLALAALLPAAIGVPVWAQSGTFTNLLLASPGGAPTNNDVIPCVEGSGNSFDTKQCTPPLLFGLLTAAQVDTALGFTPLNRTLNLLDVASTSTSLTNLLGGLPLTVANGGTGANNTTTAATNLGVNAIVQSSTQNGLAFYSQTGTIGGLSAATNGQIPIGRTGSSPLLANLTSSYGLLISNGPGAITSTVALNFVTSTLGANVNLTNTSTFFDGPSVSTVVNTGTWLVTAGVTISDTTTANAAFTFKLWDGTTVFASGVQTNPNNTAESYTMTGVTTNPAGNLRLSVEDRSTVNGQIRSNATGLGTDSHIEATRIQ